MHNISVYDEDSKITFSISTFYGDDGLKWKFKENIHERIAENVADFEKWGYTVYKKDVITVAGELMLEIYYREHYDPNYIFYLETYYNDTLVCFKFLRNEPFSEQMLADIRGFIGENMKFEPEIQALVLETEISAEERERARRNSNIIAIITIAVMGGVLALAVGYAVFRKKKMRNGDAVLQAQVKKYCRSCGAAMSEVADVCTSCGTRQ